MPSLKDLRSRIKSVKSTQRITSAMKMVAAAKLRRAQELALAARPYSDRMERMLSSLAGASGGGGSVPLIAGGSGSVIHTHITIPRRPFTYKGRRKSFLSARCLDGRFLARGTFKFRDGTQMTGSVVRRCQATG